jgi:hypothetical protein
MFLLVENPMKPPRNNKQGPNYPVIIVGLLFALWGSYALFTGHIRARRLFPHEYTHANDPHRFWSQVGITFAISAFCIFLGFIRR